MRKWYNFPKYNVLDKCRYCSHPAFYHLEMKNFGRDDQMGRWDKCSISKMNNCHCPGYGSEDNLQFLEMEYEEHSPL